MEWCATSPVILLALNEYSIRLSCVLSARANQQRGNSERSPSHSAISSARCGTLPRTPPNLRGTLHGTNGRTLTVLPCVINFLVALRVLSVRIVDHDRGAEFCSLPERGLDLAHLEQQTLPSHPFSLVEPVVAATDPCLRPDHNVPLPCLLLLMRSHAG